MAALVKQPPKLHEDIKLGKRVKNSVTDSPKKKSGGPAAKRNRRHPKQG